MAVPLSLGSQAGPGSNSYFQVSLGGVDCLLPAAVPSGPYIGPPTTPASVPGPTLFGDCAGFSLWELGLTLCLDLLSNSPSFSPLSLPSTICLSLSMAPRSFSGSPLHHSVYCSFSFPSFPHTPPPHPLSPPLSAPSTLPESQRDKWGRAKKCPSSVGLAACVSRSEILSFFFCDWLGRKKWKI